MYSRRPREIDGSSTKVNGTRLKKKLLIQHQLVAGKTSYGVILSYNVSNRRRSRVGRAWDTELPSLPIFREISRFLIK